MKQENDIDGATRTLMKDPAELAAVFNLALFGGKHVIRKENLSEADTAQCLECMENFPGRYLRRFRDILAKATVQTDGKILYLMLGIENQTRSDWRMPLRKLTYDVMKYNEQLGKGKKRTPLMPIITLVVYYGVKKWKGPLAFSEMFGPEYAAFKKYLPECRINLISAHTLSEDDLDLLENNLRTVLYYVKCGLNEKSLRSMLQKHPELAVVTKEQYNLISRLTKISMTMEEEKEEEKIDMCRAIDQMTRRAHKEGMIEGRQAGMIEGRQIEKQELIRNMWQNGLAMEVIAKIAEITLPQVKNLLAGI